jgi:hypothetical protein
MSDALAASTCAACGYEFRYSEGFYVERGLEPPRLCRECRSRRRQRLRPAVGRVVSTGVRFSIVQRAGGAAFIVHEAPLSCGTKLRFHYDPAETPRRCGLRTARDVQVVEGADRRT